MPRFGLTSDSSPMDGNCVGEEMFAGKLEGNVLEGNVLEGTVVFEGYVSGRRILGDDGGEMFTNSSERRRNRSCFVDCFM